MEIVSAIVSGYSNRQIAEKMSISQSTIKHHLTNIFDKLGVYNRLELALFAINHALAERSDHPA
jgi:DNA-binding NarL/FixJ family response regulator